MQSSLSIVLGILLLGLLSVEARLATPPAASKKKADNSAAGLLKKAKVEAELAKQEIELSKDLDERAKLEAEKSPEKSEQDAVAAKKAMVAGAKAVKVAKQEVAEAKEKAGKKTSKEGSTVPAVAKSATVKPAAPVGAETQLMRISKGLETLSNLKNVFVANQGEKLEGQEIAEGAMTTELGKKDSAVWATIMEMVSATKAAAEKVKSAGSNEDKEALMKSVQDSLNAKAAKLGNFTKEVEITDERHSEEYLLGLLMQHMGKWNATEQLNVVRKFAKELPVAKELLAHHDDSKPLAPQLGDLMDAEKKQHAAASKVAKLFLQLAISVF